jgi:protein-S-isoprenylcysteine O-methyltransferase Ste14
LGFGCALVAIWLARPTWRSLAAGASIATLGEALRIWASGHLAKGREVTRSGPYRFTRHPLYLGSFLLGIGFCVASRRPIVAVLVMGYLIVTLTAAMRTEESALEARFGDQYADYRAGRHLDTTRPFSVRQALANREQRAVVGLLVVSGLLVLKAALD